MSTVLSYFGTVWPYPQPALAQQSNISAPTKSPGLAVPLDLSSTQSTLHSGNSAPVTITVGGSSSNGVIHGGTIQTISPGQMVTPAVFEAIQQVMTGAQSLIINASGSAAGGALQISPAAQSGFSSLTLPAGVTGYTIGSGGSNPLTIPGSTLIQGSLFALQPQPGLTSVLNFGNLTVGQGGLLSGYLPSSLSYLNVFASAGLTLNVAGSLSNYGTITS
ncbi:MAG: hypothetical protein K2X81_24015, partial [Candidatus Obscuribacterales bacterium]|nr:hypothetical protein [Candidatus Obscuribacterales bacterium]